MKLSGEHTAPTACLPKSPYFVNKFYCFLFAVGRNGIVCMLAGMLECVGGLGFSSKLHSWNSKLVMGYLIHESHHHAPLFGPGIPTLCENCDPFENKQRLRFRGIGFYSSKKILS